MKGLLRVARSNKLALFSLIMTYLLVSGSFAQSVVESASGVKDQAPVFQSGNEPASGVKFFTKLPKEGPSELALQLQHARRTGDLESVARIEALLTQGSPAGFETKDVYFMRSNAVGGPGDPRLGNMNLSTPEEPLASGSSRQAFGPDIHVRAYDLDTSEINQSLATDSEGNIYAAFETDLSSTGEYYIQMYWSSDGGKTWTAYGYVLASGTDLGEPSLAVAEGSNPTLLVAYIVDDGVANPYPEVATAPLGSSSFSIHSVPLSAGQGYSVPVLWTDAIDFSGWYAYLTCEHTLNPLDSNVHFWRSTDYGVSWGAAPTVLFGAGVFARFIDPDGSYGPSLNRLYVCCYNANTQNIMLATSDDYGLVWTAPAPIAAIATVPGNDVNPEIAAAIDYDNVMVVCTYGTAASGDQIGYTYSTDGGGAWTVLYVLPGMTIDDEFAPALNANEGGAGWHLAFSSENQCYYSRRDQDLLGGLWSTPTRVDDVGLVSKVYSKKGITSNWTSDAPGVAWADFRDLSPDYDTYFDTEIYLSVPVDYSTIQAAIDAAFDHFVINVTPNIYVENIDFLGKAIIVQSTGGAAATVIDGNSVDHVAAFRTDEGPDSVLKGFTITNGLADFGGGIYCYDASPTIIENTIEQNQANPWDGGGIYCYQPSGAGGPTIQRNVIQNNHAVHYGGGIYLTDATSVITNNIIAQNTTNDRAGGIRCYDSVVEITNNTIVGNLAPNAGGGIAIGGSASTVTVTNCLVWGNNAPVDPQIRITSGTATFSFCNIMGGWPGPANIDEPPYLDPNFHLTRMSRCINMGNNAAAPPEDIDNDGRPYMGTVDIGADEYTGVHLLASNIFSFPAGVGAVIQFTLDAGPANGGRFYGLFPTYMGKIPGIPLPGGLILHVNWCPITIPGAIYGNLNGMGQALPAPVVINPGVGVPGVTLSFAYALAPPPGYNLTSNPIDIEIQ